MGGAFDGESHARPAVETRTQKPTLEIPKASRRFAVFIWVSVICGQSSTPGKPSSPETGRPTPLWKVRFWVDPGCDSNGRVLPHQRARRKKPQPRQGGGVRRAVWPQTTAGWDQERGTIPRVAQRPAANTTKSGQVRAELCTALSLTKSEVAKSASVSPSGTAPKRISNIFSTPS